MGPAWRAAGWVLTVGFFGFGVFWGLMGAMALGDGHVAAGGLAALAAVAHGYLGADTLVTLRDGRRYRR